MKSPPANAGATRDAGSIPASGRSPEIGSGSLLPYSCLENSTDGGSWWATVHGVAQSWEGPSTGQSLAPGPTND